MKDVDTSRDNIIRVRSLAAAATYRVGYPYAIKALTDANAMIEALRDERDEARAALAAERKHLIGIERLLQDAYALNDEAYSRPDIAAILSGEAVAVPVEPTYGMVAAGYHKITTHIEVDGRDMPNVYHAMIAASPYARKEQNT